MGLDMYAFATPHAPAAAVDFKAPKQQSQLHYWRKHPNLHGWMEALYRRKDGIDPGFNLAPVVLDSADIDRLEADIRAERLPETEGCFFGESTGVEASDDLAFVAKARQAISVGLTVYYIAWW